MTLEGPTTQFGITGRWRGTVAGCRGTVAGWLGVGGLRSQPVGPGSPTPTPPSKETCGWPGPEGMGPWVATPQNPQLRRAPETHPRGRPPRPPSPPRSPGPTGRPLSPKRAPARPASASASPAPQPSACPAPAGAHRLLQVHSGGTAAAAAAPRPGPLPGQRAQLPGAPEGARRAETQTAAWGSGRLGPRVRLRALRGANPARPAAPAQTALLRPGGRPAAHEEKLRFRRSNQVMQPAGERGGDLNSATPEAKVHLMKMELEYGSWSTWILNGLRLFQPM
ncbi:unnamed protein product [Nyctereutes procyonoides]|uniref:(raccoon dog) hypothetical protein n=1 Tax=Nyctereutes procyonoides TaxID=34880 RepID=A0A811YJ41_NYCPR|nr:unnamed protein product [Nyctereutes procyonoides]